LSLENITMTTIKQDDLIQSVADALQYISYYHSVDYIQAVGRAYDREQSPAAKDALAHHHQLTHVCGRSSPNLPRHRRRSRVCKNWYGMSL